MAKHEWKDQASCLNLENNLFFDKYEDNIEIRPTVDALCNRCPVARLCFANGISGKEWGVWGGIYLENGEVSKEFNKHKSKQDWANIWISLTMQNN